MGEKIDEEWPGDLTYFLLTARGLCTGEKGCRGELDHTQECSLCLEG